ncbi:hypothetical protein AC579_5679 [Pseudocercospora musae]|uniref:Uncharacterized protein n=1 Tax=Pseudocercospora musae TaxID=113226 RepID=A0A139HCP2_9PEZI|nr:hypothetical protein AC579_5679 [Pseudocercospora musae]
MGQTFGGDNGLDMGQAMEPDNEDTTRLQDPFSSDLAMVNTIMNVDRDEELEDDPDSIRFEVPPLQLAVITVELADYNEDRDEDPVPDAKPGLEGNDHKAMPDQPDGPAPTGVFAPPLHSPFGPDQSTTPIAGKKKVKIAGMPRLHFELALLC